MSFLQTQVRVSGKVPRMQPDPHLPNPTLMAQGLTGGLFTSQYVCSWHAMTSLSPFLRCLAALGSRWWGWVVSRAPPPHNLCSGPGAWDVFWFQGCQAWCQGVGMRRDRAHRSCSRACITTRSQV